MSCAFCGERDRWIKSCRTKDGHIRFCDPCWEVLSLWLVIVPGDGVVTAATACVARTPILGRWRRLVLAAATTPNRGHAEHASM